MAALLAGVLVAFLRLRALADVDDIRVGPWRTSSLIGSVQATPYLRAIVAVNGILALNRQEAIYLTAATDDDGQVLSGACEYRVTGSDIAARWWSLTAYGPDRFLIRNPAHRYSVTIHTVSRDADGGFSIAVGAAPQPVDWIATGSGRFTLTLRAYGPDPSLLSNVEAGKFPRITREKCS